MYCCLLCILCSWNTFSQSPHFTGSRNYKGLTFNTEASLSFSSTLHRGFPSSASPSSLSKSSPSTSSPSSWRPPIPDCILLYHLYSVESTPSFELSAWPEIGAIVYQIQYWILIHFSIDSYNVYSILTKGYSPSWEE